MKDKRKKMKRKRYLSQRLNLTKKKQRKEYKKYTTTVISTLKKQSSNMKTQVFWKGMPYTKLKANN